MNIVAQVRGVALFAAVVFALAWNFASAHPQGHKPIPPRVIPPRADAAPAAVAAGEVITATQIFDDAVRLNAFIAKDQGSNVVALLKAYGVDVGHIDQAPFLNKVSYFHSKGFTGSQGAPGQPGAPQGLSLSGLGAGQFADALGSLIDGAVGASDTFWTLKKLPKDDGSQNDITDVAAGLRVLSILSHLLIKDPTTSEWHSFKEVKQYLDLDSCVNSCDSVFLLLGLSYAHDHEFYTWLTVRHLLEIEKLDVVRLRDVMNQTLNLARSLESLYQHVRQIPVKLTSLSEARPLVGDLGATAIEASGVIEMVVLIKPVSEDELADTHCKPDDSFCAARKRIRDTTRELQYGFDIMGEIKTQQYAAAVGQLIAYIGTYLESHQVGSSKDFVDFFSENGAFIAAVASAHSTDDLKAADRAVLTGQIIIAGDNGSFSAAGDSGALVCTEQLGPIGIIAGGSLTHPDNPMSLSFASPIGPILDFYEVTVKVR